MTELTDDRWRHYLERTRALENAGGPEADPELFYEVVGAEEELLDAFDLPPSRENRELIWEASERPDGRAWLAGELVLRPNRKVLAQIPRLERLIHDTSRQRSPFDALPELGLTTHEYALFLYEQCCSNKVSTPVALRAMDVAERHLDELATLRRRVLDLAAEGLIGLETYLATGDLASSGPVHLAEPHVDVAYLYLTEQSGGEAPRCAGCGGGTGWFDDTLLFEGEKPWIKHTCAECDRVDLLDPAELGLLDGEGHLISAEDARVLAETRGVS